jgi:hypothetical protein
VLIEKQAIWLAEVNLGEVSTSDFNKKEYNKLF